MDSHKYSKYKKKYLKLKKMKMFGGGITEIKDIIITAMTNNIANNNIHMNLYIIKFITELIQNMLKLDESNKFNEEFITKINTYALVIDDNENFYINMERIEDFTDDCFDLIEDKQYENLIIEYKKEIKNLSDLYKITIKSHDKLNKKYNENSFKIKYPKINIQK